MKSKLLLCLAILFLCTSLAFATELRTENNVVVKSGEVIHDDLVAFADSVEIDGIVEGDLIVFANKVEIPGEVKGSLVAAAQYLAVAGTVGGSAYLAGQTVAIDGKIGRNLSAAGQQIDLNPTGLYPTAKVGKDAYLAGDKVTLKEGTIAGNATIAANSAVLIGAVGGDLKAYCDQLELTDEASVGRNLIYRAPQQATIAQGAKIGGKTSWQLPKAKAKFEGGRAKWFWAIAKIILGFITGIILLAIAPRYMLNAANAAGSWKSLLYGFLIAIVMPAALLLLCFTLVGIPLALMVLLLYLIILMLSGLPVAIWMGRGLLERLQNKRPGSAYLGLLIGIIILTILVSLPFIGWLIWLIAFFLGLGAWGRVVKGIIVAGRKIPA